jgi:hypothetical protein
MEFPWIKWLLVGGVDVRREIPSPKERRWIVPSWFIDDERTTLRENSMDFR